MSRLGWRLLASHVPAGGAGGGMVRYVVELAAALARRPDVNLSVLTVAAAAPYFRELLGRGRRVEAMPNLPTFGLSAIERYTRLVDRGGPYDVVHGPKHLLPRRTVATRVLTVHDMVFHDRPRDFGPAKRALLGRPYVASLKEAEVLICVSAATRTRLIRQMPGAEERSVVVPLAVSSGLQQAVAREVPGLRGKVFAVVVGDSSHRKNLPLLVDCWDQVRERAPGAVLAIVGPDSWAGSSRGMSFDRLCAEGKVVALGRVSDESLRWCYENAAVALAPSLLEGFGLPAVEALAFRAPLITSTDAALSEVSGGLAAHLPADRPDLWVEAISAAMAHGRQTGPVYSPRSWDEVAEDTVAAVRRHLSSNL